MAIIETNNLELPNIPPVPKKRGRPSTGKALTNAERQARNRAWKKIHATSEQKSAEISFHRHSDLQLAIVLVENLDPALNGNSVDGYARLAFLELGRRQGWL